MDSVFHVLWGAKDLFLCCIVQVKVEFTAHHEIYGLHEIHETQGNNRQFGQKFQTFLIRKNRKFENREATNFCNVIPI